MKSGIFAVIGIVSSLLIAGQSVAQEKLRIGMDPGPYPPFTSKNADGVYVGFEHDLLKAVCRDMKTDCGIVEITWDGLMSALTSGKIDVIYNDMTITEERKQKVDFSDPYYDTGVSFFTAKNADIQTTEEGLKGKIIGVTSGTIHEAYARKKFASSEIKLYPGLPELSADLVSGRVDIILADSLAMAEFLKTADGADLESKGRVPDDPILGGGVGAAFVKGSPIREKFNAALKGVMASGEYDQIQKKYFTVDIKP